MYVIDQRETYPRDQRDTVCTVCYLAPRDHTASELSECTRVTITSDMIMLAYLTPDAKW